MRLFNHRRLGHGTITGIAVVMVLGACAGCATRGGSDEYPGSEETRQINLRTNEINTGWKQYQARVNPCFSAVLRGAMAESEFAGCIERAYSASRFPAAINALHRQLKQVRDHLGSGGCRSSLDHLLTRLEALSRSVDELRLDAEATRPSAYRADTTAITRGWDAAVRSEFAMTDACGD
jgi:hypothetical protein